MNCLTRVVRWQGQIQGGEGGGCPDIRHPPPLPFKKKKEKLQTFVFQCNPFQYFTIYLNFGPGYAPQVLLQLLNSSGISTYV